MSQGEYLFTLPWGWYSGGRAEARPYKSYRRRDAIFGVRRTDSHGCV